MTGKYILSGTNSGIDNVSRAIIKLHYSWNSVIGTLIGCYSKGHLI